ncbi:T6SS effector amidase Tae4 family protein [Flavobacterium sp.]
MYLDNVCDGKYYFLNAKALNKWMRETFGTNPASNGTPSNQNHHHINGTEGGLNGINFPSLVDGLKGIYSMVSTNPNWASGHADLINNSTCLSGCHFYDTPPAPIDYIDIWVLE